MMKVELEVDGKKIELNAFTQEIIANVSVAMAGPALERLLNF
jgi:hypothetical protein